ncbi:MAG TPA: GNAT family N-acetyltransferase [Gaiellaceae bacterium]
MPTSSALREFAEAPAAWGEIDPGSGYSRVLTNRYCLIWGRSPSYTQVSRLRLDDDTVAETLHEVRTTAAEHGRRSVEWDVSSSATPSDLVDRLVTHGLVAHDHQTSLVLDTEPPRVDAVLVRPVASADDLREADAVSRAAFGSEPGPPARDMRVYLAFLDGRPVGTARLLLDAGTPGGLLLGGCVREEARGRGVYRALVRARWDDAVAGGFAGVCVQARATSRSILERLAFETVAEHEILIDPSTC